MKQHEVVPGSRVDEYFGRVSQALAIRTPRRSFLGKLGSLTIAAGAGGAVAGAGTALWAEPSSILASCWDGRTACAAESAYCGCSSATTTCPSGTCECGCWSKCTSRCTGGHVTLFCDCCLSPGSCGSSCPCGPRCCFTKEWGGGCGNSSYIIRCRVRRCGGFGCPV
jgi:hypothetical protein